MVSADKKASTTKVETTDKPKALPSIKQLEERIARRNTQNAEDQALLTQLIAKRDARKTTKLSAIEEQIAKLRAQAAELAGVNENAIVATEVAEPEVAEV